MFLRLMTQWRQGPGGPTGLDYMPFFHSLDRMDLTAEQRDEIFSDIQALESAALEIIHAPKPEQE